MKQKYLVTDSDYQTFNLFSSKKKAIAFLESQKCHPEDDTKMFWYDNEDIINDEEFEYQLIGIYEQ